MLRYDRQSKPGLVAL